MQSYVTKDTSAPNRRRKAISINTSNKPNNHHHLPQQQQQNRSSGSIINDSLAALPSVPNSPIKSKRQKRVSATFGGPGSISGSESGSRSGSGSISSYSTSTPSLPSPLLFPLSEFITYSPTTLSSPTNPLIMNNQIKSQQNQRQQQHPLSTEQTSSSPLISGTFGIYVTPPFSNESSPRRRIRTTDEVSVSSSATGNTDIIKEAQTQKNWSPKAGSKARFTFGYDDTLREQDVASILPPTSISPTIQRYDTNNNNSNSNNNNNNNANDSSNDIIQPNKDGSNNVDLPQKDFLPPLPLSSPVRSPRLQSTPNGRTSTESNTTMGFRLPQHNFTKGQSIASDFSSEGLGRIIPVRSSSRSNHSGGRKPLEGSSKSSGNPNGVNTSDKSIHSKSSTEQQRQQRQQQDTINQQGQVPPSTSTSTSTSNLQRRLSKRKRLSILANKIVSTLSPSASTVSVNTVGINLSNSPTNNTAKPSMEKSQLTPPTVISISQPTAVVKNTFDLSSSSSSSSPTETIVQYVDDSSHYSTLSSPPRRDAFSIFTPTLTTTSLPPVNVSLPKPLSTATTTTVQGQTQVPPPTYYYKDYPRHKTSQEHMYQNANFSSAVVSGTSLNAGMGIGSGVGSNTQYSSSQESFKMSNFNNESIKFGPTTTTHGIQIQTTKSISPPPLDLSSTVVSKPQVFKTKKPKSSKCASLLQFFYK
ncbi:hypothetical protein BGZ76_007439 [Entomortierella beljakovae]|nr:hypothetical protein BGZ76_007439 [Entomortierella beljakovae]